MPDLAVQMADRYQPGADGGAPPPSDPDFRTEDMFMNGAMLGRAFRLTGETRYLDLLTQFLLAARIQQDDGLFWHARSTPWFWGRGNGFAALGYSETLTYLPDDHPDRPALIDQHVRHLEALRARQHPSGMYPQVLNTPGSYHEFTATCMTGLRHGARLAPRLAGRFVQGIGGPRLAGRHRAHRRRRRSGRLLHRHRRPGQPAGVPGSPGDLRPG